MLLKSPEIVVPAEDPFLNDTLSRKESAEALTEFVVSSDQPLVICIDAPWGQGKTTFLRMWAQLLKNREVPTLYFSAWENDFSEDALVSLIGEIGSSISELSKSGDESKAREYLGKAKSIGVALLKRSIPVAAKIATAGALDLDSISEQALAALADSLAREQIERYENSKKSIRAFRDALQALAESITDSENPRPLVFIIDELDRCRPSYAIEVLEKAKHFFNVRNIIFVLGADKSQLGSSIRSIYGHELNVNGYLRRFIDFDYLLPPPSKGEFVKTLFQKHAFLDYFSKKTGAETRYEHEQALTMFSELFDLFNLTLREQEHCCALLSLAIRTTPIDRKLFPLFLCFLIVLKVKRPDLYTGLITGAVSPAAILEELHSVSGGQELLEGNYGAALEAYIVTCKSYGRAREDVNAVYRGIIDSTEALEDEKYRADRILKIIADMDWNGGTGALSYLGKKIDLVARFGS